MKTVTATLVLTVTYKLNGEKDTAPKEVLTDAARFLANRGLLSGETRMEVDQWTTKVELKR